MVRVREATPRDTDALAMILSNWIDETAWMPRCHTRSEDHAFIGGLVSAGGVAVLEEGTDVLGFLNRSGDEITALYLASAARGQGGGRRLLDATKTRADRLTLWTFEANRGARRFYDREGFREVARTRGENEEGLPDIQLMWEADR